MIALDPKDPENNYLHFNWSGWGVFGDLLTELGCELTGMSGSNDGEIVTAEVAKSWGDAIASNLARIVTVEYKDSSYAGGYRSELKVTGTQTPVFLSSAETVRAFIDASKFKISITNEDGVVEEVEKPVASPTKVVDDLDEVPVVKPATEDLDTFNWLREIADFLVNCGGFSQC